LGCFPRLSEERLTQGLASDSRANEVDLPQPTGDPIPTGAVLVRLTKALRDGRREPNMAKRGHYSVYVVYLRNPKGDGKAAYYVGMTGLSPEQRFANHRNGIKAARVVKKFGARLVPKLYAHLNPMPYAKAKEMEVFLADSLRKRGYLVFGGH
jgi:predicted GIY-YIG superfamily endonuclease